MRVRRMLCLVPPACAVLPQPLLLPLLLLPPLLQLPIESNPEVMNEYASKLGWPTELLAFHDVLSTDDWALEMVCSHRVARQSPATL